MVHRKRMSKLFDAYAPLARVAIIGVLALASNYNFATHQMYVAISFLTTILDEKVYLCNNKTNLLCQDKKNSKLSLIWSKARL